MPVGGKRGAGGAAAAARHRHCRRCRCRFGGGAPTPRAQRRGQRRGRRGGRFRPPQPPPRLSPVGRPGLGAPSPPLTWHTAAVGAVGEEPGVCWWRDRCLAPFIFFARGARQVFPATPSGGGGGRPPWGTPAATGQAVPVKVGAGGRCPNRVGLLEGAAGNGGGGAPPPLLAPDLAAPPLPPRKHGPPTPSPPPPAPPHRPHGRRGRRAAWQPATSGGGCPRRPPASGSPATGGGGGRSRPQPLRGGFAGVGCCCRGVGAHSPVFGCGWGGRQAGWGSAPGLGRAASSRRPATTGVAARERGEGCLRERGGGCGAGAPRRCSERPCILRPR